MGIGDAVILECGPPASNGVNNGSEAKLEALQEVLRDKGFDVSLVYLRQLRDVAHTFKLDNRLSGGSWTVHRDAGHPEDLRAAWKAAQSDGKKLTVEYFKRWSERQRLDADEAERRQLAAPELAMLNIRTAAADARDRAQYARGLVERNLTQLPQAEVIKIGDSVAQAWNFRELICAPELAGAAE